ncbi:hypothetical protein [Nitratireductor sp. GCM10026969]|uniref:hypothetical protein n=1 Tax=Nitratireductor sp. GCM10026969 TaxID=3252645 RepID=UPI0036138840
MTIPTPENANLEIRMDAKGRLGAYWKGERLPTTDIQMSNPRGERATVSLSFLGPSVKLNTDTEEAPVTVTVNVGAADPASVKAVEDIIRNMDIRRVRSPRN